MNPRIIWAQLGPGVLLAATAVGASHLVAVFGTPSMAGVAALYAFVKLTE